jgi:hypothetical protein
MKGQRPVLNRARSTILWSFASTTYPHSTANRAMSDFVPHYSWLALWSRDLSRHAYATYQRKGRNRVTIAPLVLSGQARGLGGGGDGREPRSNPETAGGFRRTFAQMVTRRWKHRAGVLRDGPDRTPRRQRAIGTRKPGRVSDRTPWQSPRALPTTCSVGPQITRACNCPGDRGIDSGGCGLPSARSQYPPRQRCVPAIPRHSTRDRW